MLIFHIFHIYGVIKRDLQKSLCKNTQQGKFHVDLLAQNSTIFTCTALPTNSITLWIKYNKFFEQSVKIKYSSIFKILYI